MTSKAKQTAASRRERAAALRQAHEAQERRRRLLVIIATVAAAVVIAGGATAAVLINRTNRPSLGGVQSFTEQRTHVSGKVDYPQTPPAGGPHNSVWLNCGVYDRPVANENAVHDLEHGAVWITYQPGLAAAQIAELKSMVQAQTYLTLSSYPGLPAPVVASAWGKQLRLSSADDKRVSAFIDKYRQSSNAPEPGAPCTGGTGTPVS